MPFYEFDLTIPANTLAASPKELEVFLSAGMIKFVEVQIPWGCRGLVFSVVKRTLHQVWPSNSDGSHKGNDARIGWIDNYDLTESPHSLTLYGWSPGTSYPHVITWRFQVTPAPVKEVRPAPKKKGILSALMNKGAS